MSASTAENNAEIRSVLGDTFSADCPHCQTKWVGFVICEGVQWHDSFFDLFASCPRCKRGITATFSVRGIDPVRTPDGFNRLLSAVHEHTPHHIFPIRESPSAPSHTPPNVAHYFLQGMDSLANNWDAAVLMFRETLETAMKELFPHLAGERLFTQIKEAAAQQAITPDLAEWAHHIRLEGNKAAHDGPYKEKEAQELAAFTEMVLRYLFTLPGMVREKRAKAQKEEQPSKGITLD